MRISGPHVQHEQTVGFQIGMRPCCLVSELILHLPCVCMRSKDSDKTALILSLNIMHLLLAVAISNNICAAVL